MRPAPARLGEGRRGSNSLRMRPMRPMQNLKTGLLTFALGLAALPALAAEEGGSGGGHKPLPRGTGNAPWALGIFFLVLVVLGKFAWGPALKNPHSRQGLIPEAAAKTQDAP